MVERRKGRARRAPEQTRVFLPFLVALVALRARRPRRSHIVGSAMARRSVGEVMGGTQPRAQSKHSQWGQARRRRWRHQ